MANGRNWDPTVPVILLACAMVGGVLAATGGLGPGEWRGMLSTSGQSVRVEMRVEEAGAHVRIGTYLPVGELEGFDAATFSTSGAPVRIAWKRDPGAFVLEGTGGRRASGVVRFEPSASFREAWRGLGLDEVGDADLEMMALSNVRLADVQTLKQSGVDDLDASGVIRLADDPDAMRWVAALSGRGTPLHLRDVFHLRDHGVAPERYREYQAAGVDADIEQIVRLHDRGIEPEYVAALIGDGLAANDLEGITRLHDHGVPTEYVAGIGASGHSDAGVEGVLRLHDQGVDVDYVRGAVSSGLAETTLEGIVRLHAHGVPVEYLRAVAEHGPGDRAVDDAIRLHDSGVPAEYLRSRAERGATRPSTEATIRVWQRGGSESTSSD